MISWLSVIKAFACKLMVLRLNGRSALDGLLTMRNHKASSVFFVAWTLVHIILNELKKAD